MTTNQHHSIKQKHGILGQIIEYPKTYSPQILHPIPRRFGRENLALPDEKLSQGFDYWHIFELSWLKPNGVSSVATARMTIPATSEFIVESKSLKLYLNSLNFIQFDNVAQVKQTLQHDLSECLKTEVGFEIFALHDEALTIDQVQGDCLDNLAIDKVVLTDNVDNSLLSFAKTVDNKPKQQRFYSHLLRSNCPVTNQPDWGTVEILLESLPIDKLALLKYLLSYRQHNGFHEQCVEQIFSDLMQKFYPVSLMVRAWYTRRGGIDINPVRASDVSLLPNKSRLIRQ
ncbi:7-cyano-7-deazaguanine reductase [Moraxella macacae 0408225]|uniref:7-cyano-7-deazaguanine reductase n=1 Tax=Moraxella macacae 0408225 TaxID=1230338 RepID=L2FB69_9GAMM|nr:NADPH-dependent 7-cyano-7-deazaguanine reductase QueF [Moraxella macacae]ELA09683.1 7-cyano-7-deazaguanine reductase [Moraxella macacae 0408225]